MTQFDRITLGRQARELGFVRDTFEKEAVAQLMKFIDRSGSSFALIKRFPSLQKTQKIKWQHKQGLHSPTHSCCFFMRLCFRSGDSFPSSRFGFCCAVSRCYVKRLKAHTQHKLEARHDKEIF